MAYQNTIKEMRDLLNHITTDLDKAERGNKAASQRVRTGTVKLEKTAKRFRKESIQHEKKTKGTKKPAKATAKKAAVKHAKPAAKAKPAVKHAKKPASKTVAAKPRQLAVKRSTAKLPHKRIGW
jgi:Histone H1-like protein Hc1.